MKSAHALLAVAILIVSIAAPFTSIQAFAANAR